MASKNVELVQSMYAAWERGDWRANDWADPKIELVVADGPDPGRSKGLAAIAETMRGLLGAWQDYRASPEEFRELDEERVLVLHRRSGRGKASGVDLQKIGSKGAAVIHVRDGKVTRIVGYLSREQALRDLGVAERDRT